MASNSTRPDVRPDRAQRSEQRALLDAIKQFVVLADYVRDFVDDYWELERASATLIRDPSYDNVSDAALKLDMALRNLDRVGSALVSGLGQSPDDADTVNSCLERLRSIYREFSVSKSAEASVTQLTPVVREIHEVTAMARARAIAAYHDVNTETQERLTALNQFFPDEEKEAGTGVIIQPSALTLTGADRAITRGGYSSQSRSLASLPEDKP